MDRAQRDGSGGVVFIEESRDLRGQNTFLPTIPCNFAGMMELGQQQNGTKCGVGPLVAVTTQSDRILSS